MLKAHKDEEKVKHAMALPKRSKAHKDAFDAFRKEGILNTNLQGQGKKTLEAERVTSVKGPLVKCTSCNGFYSKTSFYKHKKRCTTSAIPVSTKCLKEASKTLTARFAKEVLSCFRDDDVGHICLTENLLKVIGHKLFQRTFRRFDKAMEGKKSVMNDMRLLARLYVAYGVDHTFFEMFQRTNFLKLEAAVEEITVEDGTLKHGLKNKLYYLLKNSCLILEGHFLSMDDEASARCMGDFRTLLSLNQNSVFADAAYAINKSRQEKLRAPELEADEEEVRLLHSRTKSIIREISLESTLNQHSFIELRDAICCRLTMFNARRGGEPSRMTLKHFNDAMIERWVGKKTDNLPEMQKDLFKEMKIAYQTGKGNHLVPVLIPADTLSGLKKLTEPAIRHQCGVHPANEYLFPRTEQSLTHVGGWDATHKMCLRAAVKRPDLLTASKQRHRLSSLYAALDVPESSREAFYMHMGHNAKTNRGTYQYPLAIREVTEVGRHLHQFDKGKIFI